MSSRAELEAAMPAMLLHEGWWDGWYRDFDCDGKLLDERRVRTHCAFPIPANGTTSSTTGPAGLMGANLDDVGLSMSQYVKVRFPDFSPQRILDTGYIIGHNTLPWKQAYPDAQVVTIDAAPGPLAYGSARAKMQDREVHFQQTCADDLAFEDESFDVVWSSMFLHKLSKKQRAKCRAGRQK